MDEPRARLLPILT